MTSRKKRKSLARVFADHRRIARTASPVLIRSTARSLCFTTTHSTLTPQTEQYSESIFPNIRKTSEVLPSSRVANRFACFRGCTHTPPGVGPPSCSMIGSRVAGFQVGSAQHFLGLTQIPTLASAAPGKISPKPLGTPTPTSPQNARYRVPCS